MKILLTGATGFLGAHLVEVLGAAGHEVRALVRASSDTRFLAEHGVERALGVLETGEGLDEAVAGVDAIVHAAGLIKARRPEDFHRVNTGGTAALLEAALRRPEGLRRFVLVSSVEAQGPALGGRALEPEAPCRPITHYGRSKAAAEARVLAAREALPVTVVRPTAVYGPRDREMYAFFRATRMRLAPVLGSGERLATVVYGPDCAQAIAATLTREHPSGRIYGIDDGRTYTWRELSAILQEVLGVRAFELPIPRPAYTAAALAAEAYGRLTGRAVMLTRDKLGALLAPGWACSSRSLREELGWAPEHDFLAGARVTAAWYRAQGWL